MSTPFKVLAFFFCNLIFSGFSQVEWPLIPVDDESGLRSNTIYDLFQAENGYLYVGTKEGLFRYNGVSFEACIVPGESHELANITELPFNKIITRNFYGSTFALNGLVLKRDDRLPDTEFGYPTYLRDGERIYKCEQGKLTSLTDGIHLTSQEFDIPELDYAISALNLVYQDTLYFITNKESLYAVSFDLSENKILSSFKLQGNHPYARYFVHQQQVFLLDGETGSIYSLSHGKVDSQPITLPEYDPSEKISFIKTISDGSILIGTFTGIYQYDASFRFMGKYMQGKQTSCFLEDKEKNLWIGTLLDGLFMVPTPFVKYVKLPYNFRISTTEKINDSLLVVGSYDGKLSWINDQGQILRTLDLNMGGEIQAIRYYQPEDYLYAHCSNLFIIDNSTGKVIRNRPGYSTKDFVIEPDMIYAATSAGLKCYSKNDSYSTTIASELWIRKCVLFGEQIILETDAGLESFNTRDQSLKKITLHFENGSESKPINLTRHQGKLYFTIDNRIYHFDPETGNTEFYHSVPEQIELLAFHDETIITYNGTELRFDYPDSTYILDESKGLIDRSIIRLDILNEKLVISSNRGISIFEKLKPKNTLRPVLQIKETWGTFEKQDSNYVSEFDDNHISISFELLPNLSALGKGVIYYHFLGIDSTWKILTSSENYVLKLERLPYGNFLLEAYAVNEDGAKSNLLQLHFVVQKPFYATWWFILTISLLLTGFIWFLIQQRVSRIKRNDFENLEKERLKIKALNAELLAIRAQMNPHFIFNSISSIQNKILDNQNEQAYENLSTFSKLLRQALQFTRHEFIRLSDELDFLENYVALELMRTDNGFNFSQKTDPSLAISSLEFPALLTQPFVENAIRHGLMHSKRKKMLEMELTGLASGYYIVIRDNGIGRTEAALMSPKNEQHISFATQAVKDRIDIINRGNKMHIELDIRDLAQGTEVIITVTFPLSKTMSL